MSSFFDTYFTTEKKLNFLNVKLDFLLCPMEFLSWLVKARELSSDESKGNYSQAVSSMCEYSCLWVCGKLKDKKLKGKLEVCCGKYGCWGHHWISYTLDGKEYFLDLTLAQFIEGSPRFAITLSDEAQDKTTYNDFEKTPLNDFFTRLEKDWEIICSGKVQTMNDYLELRQAESKALT